MGLNAHLARKVIFYFPATNASWLVNVYLFLEIVEGVVPVNGYLILDSGSYRSSLIESIIIIITNKYGVFEGLKLIIGSMNSRSKTNKVSENPTE